MRVSVVIPAKNEERLLPFLFASLKEQSRQPDEVIVADAGSTDDTHRVAELFGARVVEGGMPGVGRNRGAAVANGDLLLFLDADVVLPHEDFLRDSINEMTKRQATIATCRVQAHNGNHLDDFFHWLYNMYTLLLEHWIPHAPGFCIFVNRVAHESLGGFDETVVFAEDMEYVQRAVACGQRFAILRSHPIAVSVRRLRKEGYARLAIKYVMGEMLMRCHGPFRGHLPFAYDLTHDEQKSPPRV